MKAPGFRTSLAGGVTLPRRGALMLFALGMCVARLFAEPGVGALSPNAARRRLVDTAQAYLGAPYVYGAESPPSFDCSGFVQYVYLKALDLELPRNSRSQYAAGKAVTRGELSPGDVLVFDTVGGAPSHVALYLGDSTMIHAVSAGPKTGVIVSRLDDSYFGPRYLGARRFLSDAAPGGIAATDRTTQAPPAEAAQSVLPPTAPPVSPPAGATAPAKAPLTPPASGALAAPKYDKTPREAAIAQIGFVVPAERASYTDTIPTLKGTHLAFTVTNGTGKDGTFTVIFYKAAIDFSKSTEIHHELVKLRAGAGTELPPYRFAEAGVYKLIVKDNWNTQLFERIFKVID